MWPSRWQSSCSCLFFTSRRRHTIFDCDWSSDVCSSDLTMVHTLSGIVLHRLWRMCSASDTPSEARAVIGAMIEEVKKIDLQFFERFATEPLEIGRASCRERV